jgi:hypothetical protein
MIRCLKASLKVTTHSRALPTEFKQIKFNAYEAFLLLQPMSVDILRR